MSIALPLHLDKMCPSTLSKESHCLIYPKVFTKGRFCWRKFMSTVSRCLRQYAYTRTCACVHTDPHTPAYVHCNVHMPYIHTDWYQLICLPLAATRVVRRRWVTPACPAISCFTDISPCHVIALPESAVDSFLLTSYWSKWKYAVSYQYRL